MRAKTIIVASLLSACSSGPVENEENMSEAKRLPNETVRLALTGDVMIGRGIDQILAHSVEPTLYEPYMRSAGGYVDLAEGKHGPVQEPVSAEYVWGDAIEFLEQLDPEATVINLETAVTARGEPWPRKGIHYRTHPENLDVLVAAGVDCAVLANNHVLDWGRAGFVDTLESLHDFGIATAGAGMDLPKASKPATLEIPGGRLLLFGAGHESSGVPVAWAAGPDKPGIRLLPDLSVRTARALAEVIETERRVGDRVVVSIHWGSNWGYDIPEDQRRFAHALIDSGSVDLIHGHSSHHIRGIEIYAGKLILYGAGDLINDYEGIGGHEQYRPDLSVLYVPEIDREGFLREMLLIPFRMYRFRLQRASVGEAAWIRDRLESGSWNVDLSLGEDRTIRVRPHHGGSASESD